MHFDSKLPDVGTTIFTVMSRRAVDENALNIGQGFPDYPIDPRLSQSLIDVVAEGRNQYAPMEGVVELREQIARKLHDSYALTVDPLAEITVTCGGTEALYDAVQAVVRAGDEVIVFDPAYDAYEPAVRLAGGRCLRIPLSPPQFRFDWDRVRQALSDRTRLIIINSPQNPCCTVVAADDLEALAALVRDRPISILSDEVYEHVLYDGRRHASVLAHPELRQRSFVVFSFGKTLHATGWRVGYCVAPPALTAELRKVHQFNTFSIASPLQHAVARYLSRFPEAWKGLPAFFQAKRDLLAGLLRGSGFEPVPAAGTYFQLVDYGALSSAVDTDFADRLIREAKVATIPLSPFYAAPPSMTLLRLCIAKRDETLEDAAQRLRKFASIA
jgi:methionine transaminase